MPVCSADGVEIYFETMGPADGAPLLFIEGFTAQLIGWHDAFCALFVAKGMRVIRFDNRDVGLSQKLGGPRDLDAGYTISDMARDGIAVLDALGIARAHVVGQSMGGMIAQVMAIEHPARIASLSLFYTAPAIEGYALAGAAEVDSLGQVQPRLARAEAIAAAIDRERQSRSPGFAFDEGWATTLATRSFDRCYAPDGVPRQLAAMLRHASRAAELQALDLPVAILHGRDDALLHVSGALDLAAWLPQSEVHLYAGMGHELPRPLWPDFVAIVARTLARASA
jgi:pimeloyl-ACP methyl ester carboxylesterase